MDQRKNSVQLCGQVAEEPRFSHENHGQRFCRFPLVVERLSGQTDRLNILAPEAMLLPLFPLAGERIRLEGQLRSFNNKSGRGSRLMISILCRSLAPADESDSNTAALSGVICKPPILRRTPLGRSICDVMLAVNRRYGRSDYIPCIAWGQVAQQVGELTVGSPLSAVGRIQSRQYTKLLPEGSEIRTAYELSIMALEDGSFSCEI